MRRLPLSPTYVYAIVSKNLGCTKIGVSRHVAKRLYDLKVANPDDLYVYGKVRFLNEEIAYKIEAQCHNELRDKCRQGEWFNIDGATAMEVINKFAKSWRGKSVKDTYRDLGWKMTPCGSFVKSKVL